MSLAPTILEALISTSLVFAMDGKMAKIVVSTFEQAANVQADLVDQRVYDAVSPELGSALRCESQISALAQVRCRWISPRRS